MKKACIIWCSILSLALTACVDRESRPQPKEGFLTGADGAKIFYKVTGTGSDTVVVLHGGPGAGMHSVLPSVSPLARNHVLIFYDQRGGGKSELPADTSKLKPRYFVEDLEAVRSHFGIEKMNIIAHSFGPVVTAQYAKKYPGNLKRLVFHGATGPDLQQELRLRKLKAAQAPAPADTALANRAATLLEELLQGTASDPVKTCLDYEAINRKLAIARGDTLTYEGTTCKASPEAVRYYYRYTARLAPRYYRGWDFTKGLEQVKAPLLVIYGKKDSLMIPAQQAWADAVPNGRLLLVPGAGKAAFSGNPEFVFPAIDTFLNGEWPEKATRVN